MGGELRTAVEPDLLRVSRGLFNIGLFLSSLLVLRSAGGVTIGDLCLLASGALLVMSSMGRRVVPGTPLVHLAVTLIVLSGVAAASRSFSVAGNFSVMGRLIYLVGILPWQARTLLGTRQALTRSARFWVAGAAVCAAGTLLQAKFGAGFIPGSEVTNAGRFSGLAQTVSDTGGITAVALAFCLGGFNAEATTRCRWLTTGCLAVCGIGLLLSGSVSGLFAAAGAGAYLLVRRGVSWRLVSSLAVTAFMMLQIVSSIQHNTSGALTPLQRVEQVTGLAHFSTTQNGLNTSQSRIDTDRLGLRGYAAHPFFGAGLDNASGVVDELDNFQVHNLLIGAAFQGGSLLVLGLSIPIFMSLRRGWLAAPSSMVANQLFAALVATALFSLTAPSDYNRYFWIPVALVFAAYDVSLREADIAQPSPATRVPRVSRLAVAGATGG